MSTTFGIIIKISKYYSLIKDMSDSYQHIYITSDEEIKEGDIVVCWQGDYEKLKVVKLNKDNYTHWIIGAENYKKIILTTDQDLIKDGVQTIDDEFLEWFVKNPSCEFVEVKKGFADESAYGYDFLSYKIIIPQEEHDSIKQMEDRIKGLNVDTGYKLEELKQKTLEHDNRN